MSTPDTLSADTPDTPAWTRRPVGTVAIWTPRSLAAPLAEPAAASDQVSDGQPDTPGDGRKSDTTWRSYVAEAPAWGIVVGAMAVSFWTQVFTVSRHGLAFWESLVWGCTTDFGTVAFLFMAREGSHRGTPTWGAWIGSAACAGLSVQYNVVSAIAAGDWLAVEAHLWMPTLALGTWYWLLHGRHRRWVGWTGWRRTTPATVIADPGMQKSDTPAEPSAPIPTDPAPEVIVLPSDTQADTSRKARRAARKQSETDDRIERLADVLRATNGQVSLKKLAEQAGVPRTTMRPLLTDAIVLSGLDIPVGHPLSTFRPEPGGTGPEGVAA